jgi:uncharacterized protein (TIRG00374 family)
MAAESNAAVTETPVIRKRSAAGRWFWIRLLAAAAIIAFVVEKNGRGKILSTLAAASPSWVLLAAASFFLSIFLGAYQWHLLLRLQGIDFGYAASFRTYYSGMFLNNFLPGTVGGDALRIYETQKGTEGWGKAAAATFLDRLFGFFSLSLLSLASVMFTLWQGRLEGGVVRHLLYAMGFIFVCFVAAIAFLLSRHLSALVHRLIRLTSLRWLDDNYVRFQATVTAYRARWGSMGWVLTVSCLVQVLRIQTHWFSALGLGVHIPAVFFFCFIPVIALAGVIPLSVGGWGIPQSLGAFLYALPGVLPAGGDMKVTAVALAFLPSVVGLVVMLGGGIYFVRGRSGKPH